MYITKHKDGRMYQFSVENMRNVLQASFVSYDDAKRYVSSKGCVAFQR